ncbi:MAG: Uma2 family endonuclease [Planctomycetes bacterium]|nr:Uma2 family endonuclease [Planctomycetota bacterium]
MSTTIPVSPASPPIPGFLSRSTFHRLTVAQYHQMIENHILPEEEPVELIEGYLVTKMPRTPQHDYALTALGEELPRLLPRTFTIRGQCAATIQDSEPEPDFVIARGTRTLYQSRHPGPSDTALVIEVSASSLYYDRTDKARVYARAGIPVYWVVNVIDKVIEVFTQPSGPGDSPAYAQRDEYPVGTAVPVVLDGNTVGTIPVVEVMS